MSTIARSLSSREGASHRQARTLLWAGFGGLLLLLGVLGLSALSFLYQVEIRQERIRQDYVERDRTLEKLKANIYVSGTYLRDFLLDTSETLAASHKAQYLETEGQIESGMSEYRRLLSPGEEEAFRQLSGELSAWFAAARPALAWNAGERQEHARDFIQEEVLPRRITAVGLADRIQELSEKQLEASSESVSDMFSSFRAKLLAMLLLTVVIGVALAGTTLWRLLRLEHESDRRFQEIVKARREMERLSAQVVSAQEDERRRLSRELHDQVGQVLSAMVLAIGNLRSAIVTNNLDEAARQMQLLENMVEQNVSVVRNLSLLLRPTMLDDLGLIPALRWLAREISRTSAVQVDLEAEECPESLPEEHRTCVYRVVQESIRNACRHSGATQVRVHVAVKGHSLRVSVQDDGKGFDPARETGLGILGMEERVTRLGGTLRIDSERGRGATVEFTLPLADIGENAGTQTPGVEPNVLAADKRR